MNKTYLVAGIAFMAIVGVALYFRGQNATSQTNLTQQPTAQKTTPSVTPQPNLPAQAGADQPLSRRQAGLAETTSMKTKTYSVPPPMTIDSNKTYTATLSTDKGVMKVTLFAKDTPVTVNNFVFLAREGFYNSTIFHRVIKGFMIQGGDPLGNGTGGPGYKFADESITRDYTRGTIAMANSGPNTNGSQFFIMHATYPLPKNYVIFGEIDPADAGSMATLDAIASSPVTDSGLPAQAGMGERSKPITPTVVSSVTIEEK